MLLWQQQAFKRVFIEYRVRRLTILLRKQDEHFFHLQRDGYLDLNSFAANIVGKWFNISPLKRVIFLIVYPSASCAFVLILLRGRRVFFLP